MTWTVYWGRADTGTPIFDSHHDTEKEANTRVKELLAWGYQYAFTREKVWDDEE